MLSDPRLVLCMTSYGSFDYGHTVLFRFICLPLPVGAFSVVHRSAIPSSQISNSNRSLFWGLSGRYQGSSPEGVKGS